MKYKRALTGLLGLVLALAALIGLQLAMRTYLETFALPTRGAKWIWIENGTEEPAPVSFYAVRDFRFEQIPDRATLTTAADEESLVFLNSAPIGGSNYVNGQSLKSYNVLEAVKKGRNRLVVEVRSVRGVGGLLLHLAIGRGREEVEVVTDDQWQLFRSSHEALFDATQSLPEGEQPRVWGSARVGRWSLSREPQIMPTIAELRTTTAAVGARRFRIPEQGKGWQALGKTDRSSPALGHWVTFDFGEDSMAYLALRFPAQVGPESQPIGLLYLGHQPRIHNRSQAERHVVLMSGQRIWLDARPRRFRYATYVGLTPVSGADAYPVDQARADELWLTGHATTGAFGLPVGQLGPSLEDIVWGELHSFSSVAGGK